MHEIVLTFHTYEAEKRMGFGLWNARLRSILLPLDHETNIVSHSGQRPGDLVHALLGLAPAVRGRWCVARSKRPSTHCSMPKLIDFVVQGVTERARVAGARGRRRCSTSLHTVAGEVNLKVPQAAAPTLRETAIIERYRRRESSVEEALIEMYLAGISVPPGRGHHRGAVGPRSEPEHGVEPRQERSREVEAWRNRRIEGEHQYLYLDGIVMKRCWAGEVRNV